MKYEQRNVMLQERESTVRMRVEMMEATMPVLMAWNMYQNCVEEAETSDNQTETCQGWVSDDKLEHEDSENEIQKRKNELDRLIKEIRRREKLDRQNVDNEDNSENNVKGGRNINREETDDLEHDSESLSSEEYS